MENDQVAEMLMCWGGQYGVDVFTGTVGHAGLWGKIVAKGATVVADLDGNWFNLQGNKTFPANLADGEAIYGRFTRIDLTSGAVYCHRLSAGQPVVD